MTTANEASVKHAVYVERLKARAVKDVLRKLSPLMREIFTTVAASDLENMTRLQVQALNAQLSRMIRDGYEPVISEIDDLLKEFGFYEAGWQGDMLEKTGLVADLGVASDADIWAAVNAKPFDGKQLRGWLAGLPEGTRKRVREAVTQGYTDGLGAVEVADRNHRDGGIAIDDRDVANVRVSHERSQKRERGVQRRRGHRR